MRATSAEIIFWTPLDAIDLIVKYQGFMYLPGQGHGKPTGALEVLVRQKCVEENGGGDRPTIFQIWQSNVLRMEFKPPASGMRPRVGHHWATKWFGDLVEPVLSTYGDFWLRAVPPPLVIANETLFSYK